MSVVQEFVNGGLQALSTSVNVLSFGPDVRLMIFKMIFANEALLITLRIRWQMPQQGEPQSSVERRLDVGDFSIRKPFLDDDETPQRAPNLDLLYVSKRIRDEALPAFYQSFAFSFFQPELFEPFLLALPAEHRLHVRHIVLDLGVHWRRSSLSNSFDRNRGVTPRLDRFMYQTGVSDKKYRHLFTPAALEDDWKATFMLMPDLHLLEARLWSWPKPGVRFLEPDSVNHIRLIHDQIKDMHDLKSQLEAKPRTENPRCLLEAESELCWEFSTSQCAGYSLPSALLFVDFGCYETVTPNLQHNTKVGIACLNVSLRRRKIKDERSLHLGTAAAVTSTLDMVGHGQAYRRFNGMTSWG